MPEVKLKVSVVEHTPNPETLVAMAARMCYSKCTVDELHDKVTKNDQRDFIKKLMAMGHLTPIEHVSLTFGVEGVSRALLAQITRHRIATFCVKSQRYVNERSGGAKATFNYIIPPSIKKLGKEYVEKYDEHMKTIQGFYDFWFDALGKKPETLEFQNEDSRFVLPNATETKFVFTMNARELLHFFSLRLCTRAQWEIRALAVKMLREAVKVAPVLFSYAGPPCKFGKCKEGTMKCKKGTTR
ncbi:MAG TPA: FAD-dependent thymidylate synthase [Candidatus Wallbacteria bacterium]|nr:FAD-dependent thymidylate synthase [Candidatus Wallbacteria bacterium]